VLHAFDFEELNSY